MLEILKNIGKGLVLIVGGIGVILSSIDDSKNAIDQYKKDTRDQKH